MRTLVLAQSAGVWADVGNPVVSFSVDWPVIVGLLVSVVLPLLVGLVTKVTTNPGLRAILLAALAAVTGLLTELGQALSNGTTYNLGMGLVFALVSFLVAVGLHYGIYKPTGTSTAAQRALGGAERVVPIPSAGDGPGAG